MYFFLYHNISLFCLFFFLLFSFSSFLSFLFFSSAFDIFSFLIFSFPKFSFCFILLFLSPFVFPQFFVFHILFSLCFYFNFSLNFSHFSSFFFSKVVLLVRWGLHRLCGGAGPERAAAPLAVTAARCQGFTWGGGGQGGRTDNKQAGASPLLGCSARKARVLRSSFCGHPALTSGFGVRGRGRVI